jgi:hypothetical protein
LSHCGANGNVRPFSKKSIETDYPAVQIAEINKSPTEITLVPANSFATNTRIEVSGNLLSTPAKANKHSSTIFRKTFKSSLVSNRKIDLMKILAVGSNDFWKKSFSMVSAIVLVFGVYSLKDSLLVDRGVSVFSKVAKSFSADLKNLANLSGEDVANSFFEISDSVGQSIAGEAKNVFDKAEYILTVAGQETKIMASTISFAKDELISDPVSFFSNTGKVWGKNANLFFTRLNENSQKYAGAVNLSMARLGGEFVFSLTMAEKKLEATVASVSADPFLPAKTLAKNFNTKVNSWFRSGTDFLASFLGRGSQTQVVVLVPPKKSASPNQLSQVVTIEGPRTIVKSVTEKVVYEGVSKSEVDAMLSALNGSLRQEIYKLASATAGNTVYVNNVYNAVAQTNRIDQLQNVTITNPRITGGSLTDVSFSGTSGSFSGDLSAGSFSSGGNISAGGTLIISASTGTSTFASDSSFDNGTLYIDSLNNRVGVSTSSPLSSLDGFVMFVGLVEVFWEPELELIYRSMSKSSYYNTGLIAFRFFTISVKSFGNSFQ